MRSFAPTPSQRAPPQAGFAKELEIFDLMHTHTPSKYDGPSPLPFSTVPLTPCARPSKQAYVPAGDSCETFHEIISPTHSKDEGRNALNVDKAVPAIRKEVRPVETDALDGEEHVLAIEHPYETDLHVRRVSARRGGARRAHGGHVEFVVERAQSCVLQELPPGARASGFSERYKENERERTNRRTEGPSWELRRLWCGAGGGTLGQQATGATGEVCAPRSASVRTAARRPRS